MNTTRRALCLAPLLLLLLPLAAQADTWPSRPIRIVVPFAPGGGTDIVARALGAALSARLKQPVTVENKPGGGTVIGADAVAKAEPDGHVLLVSGSTTFTVNPALRPKLPYDAQRDLVPVAMVARAPLVLVVSTSSPWKTLPELIAAAKAKPGGIAYATFGPGSGPQVRAGKLRALAVLGPARTAALPEVPSLTELKLPGAAFDAWYAVAAPGRMPAAARQVLEREVKAAMADAGLQAAIRQQAMEPVFVGSDALRPLAEGEIARYRMLAHRARIVVD